MTLQGFIDWTMTWFIAGLIAAAFADFVEWIVVARRRRRYLKSQRREDDERH